MLVMIKFFSTVLLVFLFGFRLIDFTSGSSADVRECASESLGTEMIKTELFFGLSKKTGGYVTQDEWNAFEDSVIVKVFSSGMTTIEGKGRWINENGDVIKENSRIVVALNQMTPELNEQIDTIREKYKKYFDQSSVLRVDCKAEAGF